MKDLERADYLDCYQKALMSSVIGTVEEILAEMERKRAENSTNGNKE